jgi:transposase
MSSVSSRPRDQQDGAADIPTKNGLDSGKPRPVPVLYLGSADDLLNRLLEAPGGALRVQSFQHGDVAALKAAADRLGVVSIIDRHVGKRARGLSVGTTLLLAALNRAVRPRSKRGWAGWAGQTSLHRLFAELRVAQLSSQFFWDQMECVALEALRGIEDELTRVAVEQLGVKLDTLFYDVTNFFTFTASTNERPRLPQRGRSKQKRGDLRLFSLALLVSREGQIPLCSHLYEGNRVDAKSFPDSLTRIRERLARLAVDVEQVTLVYDKGNLSKANQRLMDEASFGYVASLAPAPRNAAATFASSSSAGNRSAILSTSIPPPALLPAIPDIASLACGTYPPPQLSTGTRAARDYAHPNS